MMMIVKNDDKEKAPKKNTLAFNNASFFSLASFIFVSPLLSIWSYLLVNLIRFMFVWGIMSMSLYKETRTILTF